MKEKRTNPDLMNKLVQLNDLQIQKSKIWLAIFQKNTQQIIHKKMKALKIDFEQQARFYGQKWEDYDRIYQPIRAKYQEQLTQMMAQYQEFMINIYLELQELQCNQIITISNLKKSFDKKQEMLKHKTGKKIEEYDRKIQACLQKKNNYDKLIRECEKQRDECQVQIEKKINGLFQDRVSQLLLKEENIVKKWLHKISNKISGKTKFNTYVVEPLKVELEIRDGKLPDILAQIEQETVFLVAQMKQAKEQTNKIFENML